MVDKIAQLAPAWLLVLLLVGLVLAALLTMRGRHKRGHGSLVDAQTRMEQALHGEAETTFLAQLKKAKEDFGPEDPQVVKPMRNLARLYGNQGRYTAAEPLLHRSLAIMEKANPENIEISAVLELLGEVYEAQGRYEAAELIFLRSLAIRERVLGSSHPHVRPLFEQIARLYKKLGRTRDAKIFEDRATRVRARS